MEIAIEIRVINGHANGSICTYNFEFLNSSRAYHSLEKRLLSEGYVIAVGDNWVRYSYFANPTHPPKCIDGAPLSIIDAPVIV